LPKPAGFVCINQGCECHDAAPLGARTAGN
jgi:hypothetical protein